MLNLWEVTFPSPVVTPHPNNNTVHCEYFQPVAPGKHPGVIVLHILGGDFAGAVAFVLPCTLAPSRRGGVVRRRCSYYGPAPGRPEVKARMVSLDPQETVRGMTQAVLDVRQATAWLGSRPEIDAEQLGIMGISLGGITAALAASAEPRLEKHLLDSGRRRHWRGGLEFAAPQEAPAIVGRPTAAPRNHSSSCCGRSTRRPTRARSAAGAS